MFRLGTPGDNYTLSWARHVSCVLHWQTLADRHQSLTAGSENNLAHTYSGVQCSMQRFLRDKMETMTL